MRTVEMWSSSKLATLHPTGHRAVGGADLYEIDLKMHEFDEVDPRLVPAKCPECLRRHLLVRGHDYWFQCEECECRSHKPLRKYFVEVPDLAPDRAGNVTP